MPLAAKKQKVKDDLVKLCDAGLLKPDNHYQDMVSLIAKDIRNQRRYRAIRREVRA